jgi:hypothetical protein
MGNFKNTVLGWPSLLPSCPLPKEGIDQFSAITSNPFIVSTSSAKNDAATRRLIRKHVMQGKNKKRRKQVSSPPVFGSWINGSRGQSNDDPKRMELSSPSTEFASSGLSLISFAVDMQPYMLDLIYKCTYLLISGHSEDLPISSLHSHQKLDVPC